MLYFGNEYLYVLFSTDFLYTRKLCDQIVLSIKNRLKNRKLHRLLQLFRVVVLTLDYLMIRIGRWKKCIGDCMKSRTWVCGHTKQISQNTELVSWIRENPRFVQCSILCEITSICNPVWKLKAFPSNFSPGGETRGVLYSTPRPLLLHLKTEGDTANLH